MDKSFSKYSNELKNNNPYPYKMTRKCNLLLHVVDHGDIPNSFLYHLTTNFQSSKQQLERESDQKKNLRGEEKDLYDLI